MGVGDVQLRLLPRDVPQPDLPCAVRRPDPGSAPPRTPGLPPRQDHPARLDVIRQVGTASGFSFCSVICFWGVGGLGLELQNQERRVPDLTAHALALVWALTRGVQLGLL